MHYQERPPSLKYKEFAECLVEDMTVKAIFATAIATMIAGVAITAADAGERLRDGAMGAVAGAVVSGPVGSAGGVIGYTAGPDIARGVNPRNRRIHEDRYDNDGARDGHRSAALSGIATG